MDMAKSYPLKNHLSNEQRQRLNHHFRMKGSRQNPHMAYLRFRATRVHQRKPPHADLDVDPSMQGVHYWSTSKTCLPDKTHLPAKRIA